MNPGGVFSNLELVLFYVPAAKRFFFLVPPWKEVREEEAAATDPEQSRPPQTFQTLKQ